MTTSCDALVVGAGGFLGGHLVRSLLLQGLQVRAVDIRPLETWSQLHPQADNLVADLTVVENAVAVTGGATTVYDLAAAPHDAPPADRMTGVLVDTHLLLAARDAGVDRFVFASSAVDVPGALAATTPDDRCWRHLFTERMARHFLEDFDLPTRVVRLGPVYGEHGGHTTAGTDRAVVTTVTRLIAAAAARRQRGVRIPFQAEDPASQVYVDDAVLGLQLVAHGAPDCGPHVVVDPSPCTVGDVVATVLTASGAHLEPEFVGGVEVPRVTADTGALLATLDWEPDITLTAAVDRFWTATSLDVRRTLHLPPSVSDRRSHRLATAAGAAWSPVRPLTSPRVAGRHRYENAG